LVTKVHREAAKYAKKGYTIVLIGHAGHDEVIGVTGEAPQSTVLVQTAQDVERLEVPDPEKVAYLTQTTLSINEATQIIDRLRQRFPKIVGRSKDDVCYATSNRQEAVRTLSREADLVLVVGSSNSSNSRRLAELAADEGVASHLIDGPADIDLDWFGGVETVAVTAGASAPETIVQQCVDLLVERFEATVESRMIRQEKVKFSLPKPLR
jgi:4-hydroxy-3-methylbut-2-enyl diphosphate reductase